MSNVAEIEAAIEKLTPAEVRELMAWLFEHQQLTTSTEALFQMYDEEEVTCQARVAEKSG
jgi:hypothetical protein